MLQFLETVADTSTSTVDAGASMWSTIIMLVVMIGIFYFMLIRPENKRKKEAEQMRSALKTGDKITTIGGIIGTVVSVKDDKFVIEVGADQVRLEFAKWALSTNETAAENAQAEAKKAHARPQGWSSSDIYPNKTGRCLVWWNRIFYLRGAFPQAHPYPCAKEAKERHDR